MRNQPDLQASILDRLIDHEPELSSETGPGRFAGYHQVRESVRRDLEHLLNTRRCIHPVPEADAGVRTSVFSYGVRDFISHSPRSPSLRQSLRLEIERILILFEPRLKNVTVRLDTQASCQRNLCFCITALLYADQVIAPITFDTSFDINSGACLILQVN